jgi:hypothetical protein
MASSVRVKGTRQLNSRLQALKAVWKPIGRDWGRSDVKENRSRVPVLTGRLRRSFRVSSVSSRGVRVVGHYTGYFVDAGPKPHDITARNGGRLIFKSKGRTYFARKVHHRGYRGRPFRVRAAQAALRDNPMAEAVVKEWNRAA